MLDRTGVMPTQLCFEVTENSVITNIEHAQRFIGVLHGMGCQFALDDFGRGLSSFGNLKNLSLDYLKIDGTFIRNLAADSVNQAMVAAMIKLARTLNFQVDRRAGRGRGRIRSGEAHGRRLRAGLSPRPSAAARARGRQSSDHPRVGLICCGSGSSLTLSLPRAGSQAKA